MPRIRMERINEEVKKAVSDIILMEIKDPQVSSICSVTSCEVTNDLKHAKIFVSVLDDEKKRQRSIDALNRAAGFITRELGKRVKLRALPRLSFRLDTNIEYGIHMSKMIDAVTGNQDEEDS
ncbi:MAG: 30S ribosome-binding factor RbfA [Christensenellales bacterium]|jgi:ribosome-binding factor A